VRQKGTRVLYPHDGEIKQEVQRGVIHGRKRRRNLDRAGSLGNRGWSEEEREEKAEGP